MMKDLHMLWKTNSIKGLFAMGALFFVVSCVHSATTYEGKMVDAANRIKIAKEGQQKSVWKTEDLTLDYEYSRESDSLALSGIVTFNQHLVNNFSALIDFISRVHFTDAEGRIIGGEQLVTAGYRQDIEKISFQKEFTLPQGTDAMVFSYQGSAEKRSSDSIRLRRRGSTVWNFWKNPTP